MRKVGEILREERLKQNLTLEEVSLRTKLRREYLTALEEGDYRYLPDEVYVRGFVTAYSRSLGLDPSKILPFYKREVIEEKKDTIKAVPRLFNQRIIELTPVRIITLLMTLSVVVFIIVMFIQFSRFQGAPVLILDNPAVNGLSNIPTILIRGETSVDVKILINGQEVKLGIQGNFSSEYELIEGVNHIIVTAENKNGKTTTVERIIEYHPPD